jgi:AraC family transcriptional regulator
MKKTTLAEYKARLLPVLLYIQQHLDEPLPLEELASIAFFSPFHFHRFFKGMTGESVKGHVRRLRMEKAAGVLKRTRRPVIDIALDAGYETHESFTRAFHDMFGTSPTAFRASRSAVFGLPAQSGVHYQPQEPLRNFKARKPGGKPMQVQIKTCSAKRVAYVRHVGPYGACGEAWDRLLPPLGQAGWLGGDTQFIGLCHDDPEITAPDQLRYDACVTVPDAFQPCGEIGVQVVPGGEYAITTHFGPYDRLGKTYARLLGEWLPRSGRELAPASCFEVYLNSPDSTDPKELITDIFVPLKPNQTT